MGHVALWKHSSGSRLRGPVEAVARTHRPRRAPHCRDASEHRNRGVVARAAETETRVVEGAQNTNPERRTPK